jgi:hypothetical protein
VSQLVPQGSANAAGQELSITDADNPRSLINLVPEAVRNHINNLPEDFLHLTEEELEAMTPNAQWTMVDRRLRTAFWLEYERVQATGGHMVMTNIFGGTCSKNYFYDRVLTCKPRLGYLLQAPQNYRVATEEALIHGVNRVREILDLPLFTELKDGRRVPDPKVADVIIKAVAMLDMRVKGAVIQRIQQHNINENLNQKQNVPEPSSMAEIDEQLKELQAKAQALKNTIPAEVLNKIVTDEEDEAL